MIDKLTEAQLHDEMDYYSSISTFRKLRATQEKINEIIEVINGLDIEMRPMTKTEIEQRDNFLGKWTSR
jgi:hypothetical protein